MHKANKSNEGGSDSRVRFQSDSLLPTNWARLLKTTTDFMDSKNWLSYFVS